METVVFEREDENPSLSLRERPRPEPGLREALVRVEYAGVCGSDVAAYEGKPGYDFLETPRVFGHEYAGTVERVGDAVERVVAGARVTELPLRSCGTCRACRRGRENVCENVRITGFHHDGAFAAYVTAPEENLHAIPDGVPFETAALGEPLSVAGRAVFERGAVTAGDRVLVLGPGPMGAFAALLARAAGARVTVGGLPADGERLSLFADLDVETVDVTEVDVTSGEPYDVTVDATGSAAALSDCVEAAERGGRTVGVGIPPAEFAVPGHEFVRAEKTILASYGATGSDFERTLDLLERVDLPVSAFVTEYEPERTPAAFEAFDAAATVKPLVRTASLSES